MSLGTARQRTPPPGRHQFSMGKSMTSFLKQRKGIQQPKQNKAMPTSNYYHFKYNFSPESVDTTKPGVVELSTNKDFTNVHVERASGQSDDAKVHVFRGKEEPAKEIECIFVYDEDNGTITLEKLDSSLSLQYDGRSFPKARHPSASPMESPSPAASTSKIDDELENEIFRELDKARAEDEAAIESDTPLSAAKPTKPATAPKVQRQPPPVFINKGKPSPKLHKATAGANGMKLAGSPLATSVTPASQVILPDTAKPTAKSPEKRKAPTSGVTGDADVEELEFGMPTKRTRSPVTPPTVPAEPELSLPGSLNAASIILPGQSTPPITLDEEDEEVEWEEVGVEDTGTQENEMDKFAEEMELNLGEFEEEEPGAEEQGGNDDGEGDDDDDLFGDGPETAEQEQESNVVNEGPISLNAYAGGDAVGLDEDDDDDYSSSEDSDDD